MQERRNSSALAMEKRLSCTNPSIWGFQFILEYYIVIMMTSSNETFSALLAIVQGIHWSLVNSPHKGQWRGTLMFTLICVWINGWVSNHEAGDLRCHCAHYDVTVMMARLPLQIASNSEFTVFVVSQIKLVNERSGFWWSQTAQHSCNITVIR